MWKPALTREWDLKEASSKQLGCAGLFSADGVITWCWLCSPWGWVPVASPTLAHLSLWSQRGTCNGLGIEESRSVRKNFCGRKIDIFETHSFAWGHRDRKIWRDDGWSDCPFHRSEGGIRGCPGRPVCCSFWPAVGRFLLAARRRCESHAVTPGSSSVTPGSDGHPFIPRMLQGTFFELSSVLDAWGNHDECDRNSLCCYRAHGVTGERNIKLVLTHVII